MNAQLDGFRRQLEAIAATLPDSRINIPDQLMAQLVAKGLRRESIEQFAAQSMQPIETMDVTLAHALILTYEADRLASRRAEPSAPRDAFSFPAKPASYSPSKPIERKAPQVPTIAERLPVYFSHPGAPCKSPNAMPDKTLHLGTTYEDLLRVGYWIFKQVASLEWHYVLILFFFCSAIVRLS